MSRTGIPSVMTMTSGTPASAFSMIASAAAGGGTKIAVASAPVSRTAAWIVWKMGTVPWKRVPPRFGVTPATIRVPYASICSVWKLPAEPVMPCTRTRVSLSTKMLKRVLRPGRAAGLLRRLRGGHDLAGGIAEVVGGDDLELAVGEDVLAELDVRALEPHHERDREADLLRGGHDAVRDDVALHDAAEDVDEDRPDLRIGQDDLEGGGDLLLVRASAYF